MTQEQSSIWLARMIQEDQKNGGDKIDEEVALLARDAANTERMYHVTSKESLKSIICSNSFYLKSLSCNTLNDSKEIEGIENPELKNNVFVGCFTKKRHPNTDHWDEYGYGENGVIFRFKKEWVTKQFTVLDDEWSKITISQNNITERLNTNEIGILSAGFYTVKYDTEVIHQLTTLPYNGRFIHQEATGLVKPIEGISKRTNKKRIWQEEEEIRFRVILSRSIFSDDAGIPFNLISMKLSDHAFETLELGFSPGFPKEQIDRYIAELRAIKADMNIELID